MPILLVHPGKHMSNPYRDAEKRLLIRSENRAADYLAFESRCVRKFGPAAGIFLRQLVYWTGREHDPEGWIYKTQAEMERETGLSRKQQERAREILGKYGVLEEKKRGLHRKLWYRVGLEALLRLMETPHSTLNQWARKQGNSDARITSEESYGFSRDSIIEHTDEVDSTIPASEYVNIDPASEYGNGVPTSEDGIKRLV
jgi:hypothetical protein